MTILRTLNDLPTKGKIYVIVTMESINIPGDERSRTNPGHGYPASVVHHPRILFFTDPEEWRIYIAEMTFNNKQFVAWEVFPAKITPNVEIEVSLTD